jgi:hypothetical protein
VLKLKPADGQDEGGTMRLDLSVGDLNRRQAIGPPAEPRPLSELTSALSAFARAQSQAQAQGSSSGSSAAKPATAYDRCLTEAGSDLAAAQRCADLVGR